MKNHNYFAPVLMLSMALVAGCGDGSGSGDGVFNPRNPFGAGPAAISLLSSGFSEPAGLGSAGYYVILAKTGISDVVAPGTTITGSIGVSPAAATYITNFALVADASNQFSTSSKVVGGGKVYGATYASPTPSNLTTAIGSMELAYNLGAARNPPDHTELYAGNLTGRTLAPDLYKWSGNVLINTGDVTLSGSSTDVWIFQIAGNLTMDTATRINLAGGALAKNIFWVVAGQVTLEAGAHFEGIILSKTAVVFKTGAEMNGRVFAQSAVTLDDNVITEP